MEEEKDIDLASDIDDNRELSEEDKEKTTVEEVIEDFIKEEE